VYLGIDFLITPALRPYVVEANVGLPGGAQEFHLTHLVHFGKPSGVFRQIEEISQRVYGRTFKDYLHSLPFVESLKPIKIWMDGMGPFPDTFHPGIRLEDKWNQYQLISPIAPMPETMIFDPLNLFVGKKFLERKRRIVLKRRVGRGGRDLRVVTDWGALRSSASSAKHYLLQEYIESKVDGYFFSIRSVAFGGEFICMYANLSTKSPSNHGTLVFVTPASPFGLSNRDFKTKSFIQRSWEAGIWFGENEPQYLRHNLYEDEVAQTSLLLPETIYEMIKELSVKIERMYEAFNLTKLPRACFEAISSGQ